MKMDAVNTPTPTFEFPQEPSHKVPTADQVNVSVPSRDNRYFQPPCDGLRKPEFTAECKQNYESSYASGFTSSYKSQYQSAYKSSFETAATRTYGDAFAQDVPSESLRGKSIGSEHLGTLNGYNERFAVASREYYEQGKLTVQEDLKTGHLLVVKSVVIEEESGDGVLQPGERLKLKVVIDNLGGLSSALEGVEVKIANTLNAKDLTTTLRGLPALQAQTRTTIAGVVSAVSTAKFIGEDVKLEGTVALKTDDDGRDVLFKFEAKETSHFPVELVAIDASGALAVNKWSGVAFKFQNISKKTQSEVKMKASTKPKNVEIDNKDGFVLPSLATGESTIIKLPVMPSVWAGGAPVVFSIETLNAEGGIISDQRLKKDLDIARSAKLSLLGSNGQPTDGTPIKVTAGSTVTFRAQFQLQSQTRRGPYVFRYANASDPQIIPWNSTTRIDYGMIGPTTTIPPVTFTFKVPTHLKGKPAWIAMALDEANAPIHMLQVWLDVQ